MNNIFPGVRPPSIDMQAVRDGRRSVPLYFDVPLTTSRSIANGTTTDSSDTSGKALVINIAGNSFYSDPTYDLAGNPIAGNAVVHFQDVSLSAQGTPFLVSPLFIARIPFTQVLVENYAQAGKKMRVIYGVDLDFQPGITAQVAPVQVIDGGKTRTLANQAFLGNGGQAKVAAQFSHVQLRMPAGATKRAICRQVVSGCDGANGVTLLRLDAALTTLIGNAPSKLVSGAVSVAEIRSATNVGLLGTGGQMAFEYVQAAVTAPPLVLGEPIVIRPNEGIVVRCTVVNTDLNVSFEFIEEDNV